MSRFRPFGWTPWKTDAWANLRTIFRKSRSKNAGPFWLTIDIFCKEATSFTHLFEILQITRVAVLFGIAERMIRWFKKPKPNVIKISLPRPQVQGTAANTHMHGASFAVLIEEFEMPPFTHWQQKPSSKMMLELAVFSWMRGQDLNLRLSSYEPNIWLFDKLRGRRHRKGTWFSTFQKGNMSSFHKEFFLPIWILQMS